MVLRVPAPLYHPTETSFICFLLEEELADASVCAIPSQGLQGGSLRIGVLWACADEGILAPQHKSGQKYARFLGTPHLKTIFPKVKGAAFSSQGRAKFQDTLLIHLPP